MGTENPMGLPQEEYEKLMAEYKAALPSQLEGISKAIENLKASVSKENFEALRLLVHRIAGNAGVYGFQSVTDFCRAWEKELVDLINQYSSGSYDENFFNGLGEKFKEVQKRFG